MNSDLFSRINTVHATLQGWCESEKAITLASMVLSLRPECVVEVGIFGGKSLIPMAMSMKEIGRGLIIGIDPWSKEVAVREQISQEHRDWWDSINIDNVYNDFISKVNALGLNQFVSVIRNESRFVQPPAKIDLLHLDGSHSDTTVNDAMKFAPRVTMGGFCIMDDTDDKGHGSAPMRAVQWMQTIGFKKLYVLGSGEVLQRVR